MTANSWQVFQGETIALHYRELGKKNQPAVLLLHGWPDSPHTWDAIAPQIAALGFRIITPFLRGFGPNRFHDEHSFRSGQLTAIANDICELANFLQLEKFAIVGHDWGARCAYILAALYPERVTKIVAMSVGYAPAATLPLLQAQNYWYQWYMATPQGEAQIRSNAAAFCEYLWQQWAPNWQYSAEQLAQLLQAINNPDWADVTIHSYTQRWGNNTFDPSCTLLEEQLKQQPEIKVPCLIIHGAADPCNDPITSDDLSLFTQATRVLLPEVGHYPQHEAEQEVIALIESFLTA